MCLCFVMETTLSPAISAIVDAPLWRVFSSSFTLSYSRLREIGNWVPRSTFATVAWLWLGTATDGRRLLWAALWLRLEGLTTLASPILILSLSFLARRGVWVHLSAPRCCGAHLWLESLYMPPCRPCGTPAAWCMLHQNLWSFWICTGRICDPFTL